MHCRNLQGRVLGEGLEELGGRLARGFCGVFLGGRAVREIWRKMGGCLRELWSGGSV